MFQYKISTGTMSQNGTAIDGTCYSGQPEARNNPARVHEHRNGPIPPGKYRIGAAFKHATKGPMVMRLTPMPGTDTFGRDGFLIHGDSIAHPGTASEGCIIAPHDMRMTIDRARDRVLEVVV